MIRRFVFCILLFGLLLFRAPVAQASGDVLKLIPESVASLVLINDISAIDGKIEVLGRHIQLPLPSVSAILSQQFSIRDAVDANGTIALAVLPSQSKNATPAFVLFVPVTDYGKLLDQLKPKTSSKSVTQVMIGSVSGWMCNVGGYAVLTDATHRNDLDPIIQHGHDIPLVIKPWREWLSRQDVAGIVFRQGIHEGQAWLETKPAAFLARYGTTAAELRELFREFDYEISSCGIGIQGGMDHSLRISSRTIPMPSRRTIQPVAENPLVKENALVGLPNQPFALVTAGIASWDWNFDIVHLLQRIKEKANLFGLTEAQAKTLPDVSSEIFTGTQDTSGFLGVGCGADSFFSNTIVVTRVDDSQRFLAACEDYFRRYAKSVEELHIATFPSVKVMKTTFDGHAALKIVISLSQANTRHSNNIVNAAFGFQGKIESWLVAVDEGIVVNGFGNKRLLWSTIDAVKHGDALLETNVDLLQTDAMLPRSAMWTIYISPNGLLDFVKRLKKMGLLSDTSDCAPRSSKREIPNFAKTPPIGFAMTAGSNEVCMHLFLPVEVLRVVGPHITKIFLMRGDESSKNHHGWGEK